MAIDPETLPDAELLVATTRGDEAAFLKIYERHRDRVFRFAYRMTGSAELARDVTHSCFASLLEAPDRYDSRRASLATYLCSAARNQSLRHARHSWREKAGAAAAAARPASMRVRFLLSRRQGEKLIASRPYTVALSDGDDARSASIFSGAMLPLEAVANGRSTVMLKDIGAGLHLQTARLPDGSYRVDVNLSDGTLSPAAGAPRVQAFKVESRLYLVEGETVVVASAVDPQTGDVIEGSLTLEGVR